MDEEDLCTTLAYNTSPTSSKRTTFQDELETAVNERAARNRALHRANGFSDEDDGDDDVLEELLKTRRKKMDMFKASKSKISLSVTKMSDEEEENIRPKKVSFLKKQRNSYTHKTDNLRSDTPRSDTPRSDSFRSDSTFISHQSVTEAQTLQRRQQDSDTVSAPQHSRSEPSACMRSLSESPLSLYSKSSQWEHGSECVSEATPPTPAPRQRADLYSARSGCDGEDGQTQAPSSRAAMSVLSNTITNTNTNTNTSFLTAGNSGIDSQQHGVSVMVNTHSRPLEGAESADFSAAEQKNQEEYQFGSEVSPVPDNGISRSSAFRPGSSRRSRSTSSYTAESRYLGTLKVLEQETGLDTADSLRATVYQNWLKNKQERLQVTLRAKKQEEKLKEEKKIEEERSKKAEAKASYEAWKENKREALREKIRDKQEVMRKLQKEMEDEEERKETAKLVFEKWKREHDELLREQLQKQELTENRLKEKKEKEKEERTRESSSSFTQWNSRKKKIIEEKLKSDNRKKEIKEIEEKYEKEERERTALEMYEKWLRRKEFQQKREQRERNMKAEEPQTPWSPPNRTVPFGK
ncbi:microtubule-associated protein 9 isoform X2 [Tachysurus fulvidraco]|uniref:microtubule-associated protein 9 isoform X2 n=1 Tax=Tachysurus fulvidraco TaxID=1234273 RepID=UPI001FEEA812|nr:microtubule-associated protein 9 isoform X2 [Tachysurus fulvidraco]XP_047671792.1 microtubule-associated protein 9 isoform X2 [Tachysurus fulvidraco]